MQFMLLFFLLIMYLLTTFICVVGYFVFDRKDKKRLVYGCLPVLQIPILIFYIGYFLKDFSCDVASICEDEDQLNSSKGGGPMKQ